MRTPQVARTLLLSLLLPLLPSRCGAAEAAQAPDPLQQKSEEIERLKRELDSRERELKQLREDNERLKKSEAKTEKQRRAQEERRLDQDLERLRKENERLRAERQRAPAAASSPIPVSSVPAIESLPPLEENAVVPAEELVGHFQSQPALAAARYKEKTFRVQGEVDRFDRSMVTRDFSVILASPDRGTQLRFKFNYVGKYRTVFTARDGRELTARDPQGGDFVLLTVGEPVVLKGRCHGLKDGTVTFGQAEVSK